MRAAAPAHAPSDARCVNQAHGQARGAGATFALRHRRLPLQGDFLLYDGDCPLCSAYVAFSRLRQLYPNLRVLSARAEPALVAELRQQGYEINVGMVLSLGGTIYFAADATQMIARLGRASPSPWRRQALALTGTAPWARSLYPWLNRGRRLLLWMLGRRPIA
jgi:predicted DCC family thiol-disulfide oxidoreductase YuxK